MANNFERGQDPRQTMGIGRFGDVRYGKITKNEYSEEELEIILSAVNKKSGIKINGKPFEDYSYNDRVKINNEIYRSLNLLRKRRRKLEAKALGLSEGDYIKIEGDKKNYIGQFYEIDREGMIRGSWYNGDMKGRPDHILIPSEKEIKDYEKESKDWKKEHLEKEIQRAKAFGYGEDIVNGYIKEYEELFGKYSG